MMILHTAAAATALLSVAIAQLTGMKPTTTIATATITPSSSSIVMIPELSCSNTCIKRACLGQWPQSCLCANQQKVDCWKKCGGVKPVLMDCGVDTSPDITSTVTALPKPCIPGPDSHCKRDGHLHTSPHNKVIYPEPTPFAKCPTGHVCTGGENDPNGLKPRTADTLPIPPPPPPRDDPPADSRYACNFDSDCVKRTIPSCCGVDTEGCARPDAVFSKPDCKDFFGTCGWPRIEACACQNNQCVGLPLVPSSTVVTSTPPTTTKKTTTAPPPTYTPAKLTPGEHCVTNSLVNPCRSDSTCVSWPCEKQAFGHDFPHCKKEHGQCIFLRTCELKPKEYVKPMITHCTSSVAVTRAFSVIPTTAHTTSSKYSYPPLSTATLQARRVTAPAEDVGDIKFCSDNNMKGVCNSYSIPDYQCTKLTEGGLSSFNFNTRPGANIVGLSCWFYHEESCTGPFFYSDHSKNDLAAPFNDNIHSFRCATRLGNTVGDAVSNARKRYQLPG
ncbi:hypothetical protein EJ08DRAFT_694168 [Tothia fuscella]|uniref:Uncharacterized protein n=1 Tax=Tothia fuscella TaxID=1048955 RepID=A0A9P4NXR4_9PEZI|nr:hypothetical protein EJ08DRAFT_694168 [Tothia fuscella]